ncbi:MAG: hypothetical protein O7C75_05980, partial [Verrucomicrobia bacterium]|nr:hypothetical protein [Verrucomicrobiota bacterium]
MKKYFILLPLFLATCLFTLSQTFAKEEGGPKKDISLFKTAATANRTLVNVGQVAMWVYADGRSAVDPAACSGLFFPRGNNPNTAVIYQDGFIWGGFVKDGADPQLRVGGATYSIGTA